MCDTCKAIEVLTREEGDSVTILCANPEFTGDNYAIEVSGDWTNWDTFRYGSNTTLEALEKAILSREQE